MALVATIVVMGCYVVGVVVLNFIVVHRLTTEVDGRLAERLADANKLALSAPSAAPSSVKAERGADIDDAPIFLWVVAPSGTVTTLIDGGPTLPGRRWTAAPVTVQIGRSEFRFEAVRQHTDWLVAGQSVAEIRSVQSVLRAPEIVLGVSLLVAVFAGALAVGLRASAPLEVVRRRQAAFTADASHELRTPLSVIEAEVSLALSRPRTADAYERVLVRVGEEARRLRRIVDDLMWLARADGEWTEANSGQISDLAVLVASCTSRFQAIAETRNVSLTFNVSGLQPVLVQAPPDWLDRLTGVLVDNACKYAGTGGQVEVRVCSAGHRVGLRVDDSGPGIPPDQRPLIFDRFHRATESPGGTGLGLAIADSVVRSTQGTWAVGGSPLGGARMEVWWRRSTVKRGSPAPPRTQDGGGMPDGEQVDPPFDVSELHFS